MSDLTTQHHPIKSNCYCPLRLILGHCFVMLACSRTLPFCKAPPASHSLSLLPHPSVSFSFRPPCLAKSRLRLLQPTPPSKNCTNKVSNVLSRLVIVGEGCPWGFVVEPRVWSHLQVKRNLITGQAYSAQEVGIDCEFLSLNFLKLCSEQIEK